MEGGKGEGVKGKGKEPTLSGVVKHYKVSVVRDSGERR